MDVESEPKILTQPLVWYNPDKILRGKRLEHRDKELQRVLIRRKLALQQKVLVM